MALPTREREGGLAPAPDESLERQRKRYAMARHVWSATQAVAMRQFQQPSIGGISYIARRAET